MSYTAPEYVDTRAQAILVLASTIADEDKTGIGNCSVRAALDVLADTLADSDVTIPETDAGEILALAQYVSGGGGGVTLGPLGYVYSDTQAPTVGGYYQFAPIVQFAKIGDTDVCASDYGIMQTERFGMGPLFAGGMTLGFKAPRGIPTIPCYRVSFDAATEQFTAVADWSSNVTRVDGDVDVTFTFTMPSLDSGEAILFVIPD